MFNIFEIFRKQTKAFQKQFTKQLLKLVTSAFGLVAALAWNEVIKESVRVFVKPLLGETSTVVSLLLYAVIVTLLAVLVTFNLTKSLKKNED